MNKSLLIFFAAFIMFFCGHVFGQSANDSNLIDVQLQQCLDSSQNETTYGMSQCMVKARDAWDKQLNKYYNLLMTLLSKDDKEKLRTSQRNWLVFRNSENTFSVSLYTNIKGTMWGIAKVQREIDLLKHRTSELQGYYNDKLMK